jgi:acetyl-CoA C-acetyltransferase
MSSRAAEAVIVAGVRTPIGTAFKGTLAQTSAFDLAQAVVSEAALRAGLSGDDVDDIILGESMNGGGDIARYVAVAAGLTAAPGLAVQRHCASGLTSIGLAAAGIGSGQQDVVIAGGTYSQSMMTRSSAFDASAQEWKPWNSPSHPETPQAPAFDMSITVAWNTAVECGITREEMDAWALGSHQKALAAIDEGKFVEEIVPIEVTRPDGSSTKFEVDEHPRRGTTMEKLAGLKVLHPEIDGFSITAGNASGLNDGAAAVVVMSPQAARDRGLAPLAVVRGWGIAGVEPARTGMAPIEAIPKALKRAGLSVGDVDLWEINEAFAVVPIATSRALDINPDLINPVGSGCSIGHPISASGGRMVVSLINELRRRGGGIGVASMCAGGGMGYALVLEVAGS